MPDHPGYRLYHSFDGVLIRTPGGEIELSAADAAALGAELYSAAITTPATRPERPANHNLPWTPADDEWLRHLRVDERMYPSQIAREMGRTKATIIRRINRKGLPPVLASVSDATKHRHTQRKARAA